MVIARARWGGLVAALSLVATGGACIQPVQGSVERFAIEDERSTSGDGRADDGEEGGGDEGGELGDRVTPPMTMAPSVTFDFSYVDAFCAKAFECQTDLSTPMLIPGTGASFAAVFTASAAGCVMRFTPPPATQAAMAESVEGRIIMYSAANAASCAAGIRPMTCTTFWQTPILETAPCSQIHVGTLPNDTVPCELNSECQSRNCPEADPAMPTAPRLCRAAPAT